MAPTSTSSLVRRATARQLRQAADAEILKSTAAPAVDPRRLYADARRALSALSTLLGDAPWFGRGRDGHQAVPGLFDASLFAYTHLVLDDRLGWQDQRLAALVREFPNLVGHQSRLYDSYFGERSL